MYGVPPTDDYLSRSSFHYFTAISNTLAVDDSSGSVTQVFIHGNSDITVIRGVTDVSGRYAIYRMRRLWERPLSPTPSGSDKIGGPTGAYTLGGARFAVDSDDKPPGQWFDTPGLSYNHRNTGTYERTLHEFVAGIQDPESRKVLDDPGAVYLFVVFDISPNWYRVRMSAGINLTAAQWKGLRGVSGTNPIPKNTPYRTESSSGITWALDTSWVAWDTYNNQLPLPGP